jgi:hypothetical protein
MIEIWGGVVKKIHLCILIDICQKKGVIKHLNDFKTYQSKFMIDWFEKIHPFLNMLVIHLTPFRAHLCKKKFLEK